MKRLFLSLMVLVGLSVVAHGATARPLFTTHAHSIDIAGEVIVGVESDSKLTLSFSLPPSAGAWDSKESPYQTEGRLELDGQGSLPMVTRWVIIPPRANVTAVVQRQQGDWIDGRNGVTSVMDTGLPLDGVVPVYPPKPVHLGKPMVIRGVRMIPLTIFPTQINTKSNDLFQSRELDIELVYTNGSRENIVTGAQPPITPAFARLLGSIAINPPPEPVPTRDYWAVNRGKMLIVRSNLADVTARGHINEFAKWKRQQGWDVAVTTFNASSDSYVNIKNSIKNAYNNGLDYVLLVGYRPTKDTSALRQDPFYFPSYPEQVNNGAGVITVYSDNQYACMDDDNLPDLAIGRLTVKDNNQLAGVVQRTIKYEREPFIDAGNDWHSRALITTERAEGGGGIRRDEGESAAEVVALLQWEEARLKEMGYRDIRVVKDIADEEVLIETVTPILNEGVSVALADGWLFGSVRPKVVNGVEATEVLANAGRRNPFVVAISQYYSMPSMVPFFQTTSAADPKGPVAVMGAWYDDGYSDWWRSVLGAALSAMKYDDVYTPGDLWMITQAKLAGYLDLPYALEGQKVSNDGRIRWLLACSYVLGDPSVNVFTATPKQLVVTKPNNFVTYDSDVRFTVKDNNEQGVKDAVVVIRTAKNDTTETRKHIGYTNSDGAVHFVIPDSGLTGTEVELLVSKHNYQPYKVNIPINAIAANSPKLVLNSIAIEDANNRLDRGDSSVVRISIRNKGQAGGNAAGVACVVTSDDPLVTIVNGQFNLGDIAVGNSVNTPNNLMIKLNHSWMSRNSVPIKLVLTDNQARQFTIGAEIVPFAPYPVVLDHKATNFNGDPASNAAIFPRIQNLGNSATGALVCTLSCEDPSITIVNAVRQFATINAGATGTANDSFRVKFNVGTVPPSEVAFKMTVASQNAAEKFRAVLDLVVPVVSTDKRQPFKPDSYGYVCFESEDAGFNPTPKFNWREINPDINGHIAKGAKLDIDDPANDGQWDRASLVKLPFPFKYYGEEFDSITVSNNGWLSMGTAAKDYRSAANMSIPGFATPDAQLAIYWDDMLNRTPRYAGVYSAYLEDQGIFVLEWSNVSMLERIEMGGGQPEPIYRNFSFQIVLKDPSVYPTPTGDGEILFQYLKAALIAGHSESGVPQYPTIGISNLDGTDGVQYEYWGKYHSNASPIGDGVAIKFTTAEQYNLGSVKMGVVRASNNSPVIGAKVIHNALPEGIVTDNNGSFFIDKVRPRRYHNVIISADGFNPAFVDIVVPEGDTLEVEEKVKLVYPDLTWKPNFFELSDLVVQPDSFLNNQGVTIINKGDGPLEYTLTPTYKDFTVPAFAQIDSLTDLEALFPKGLAYDPIGNLYNLVGRPSADRRDQMMFPMELNGAVADKWAIPKYEGELFNVVNITWDGMEFWGTGTDDMDHWRVIRFTDGMFEPSEITWSIPTPLKPDGSGLFLCIAYDPVSDEVWLADDKTDIVRMNRDGEITKRLQLRVPGREINIHGLMVNPWDSKGVKLYVMDTWREEGGQSYQLLRVDPETGVWEVANPGLAGYPVGPNDTVFRYGPTMVCRPGDPAMKLAMVEAVRLEESDNNRIRIYEAGPNITFMEKGTITNRTGVVQPNGSGMVKFNVSAKRWKDNMAVEFGLKLVDQITGETVDIPAKLTIDKETGVEIGNNLPLAFDLKAVYPNPFNSVTRIVFSADRLRLTKLHVYDSQGRLVGKLYEDHAKAGFHTVVWNADRLSSGVYFLKLESENVVKTMKIALVK